MTPEQAIAEANAGKLRPIYLVAGEETYLATGVVAALRKAALMGAVPGLNEDHFNAGERDVGSVLGAARTLPMMSKRRLVTVQHLEEWEPKANVEEPTNDAPRGRGADSFDRLVEYAKQPSLTTTLLLVGRALDKRRKLMTTALREGWLVACDPLPPMELPGFVARTAARLGGRLEEGVAELIAELAGPELSLIADAVDRLCLYAGDQLITDAMVLENVVRLRAKTVWELINAVGRRDAGAALAALDDVFDPNESIRLVGLLAWSARQLLRFEAGISRGLSQAEAAQLASAPPFKARELAQQIKNVPKGTFLGWLVILTDVDRALKGGSKLPPKAILERAVLDLCRSTSAPRPRSA
jgi:DNA polymerase-3 subunit delta